MAIDIWDSVKDLFINEKSFVDVEVFKTEYEKHAYYHTLDLEDNNKYHGIICASGDGIVHEVVQAIMANKAKNGKDAYDFPIGVLPCGSSNALAKVIGYESGEDILTAKSAAYFIMRGETRQIDVLEIEFLDESKVYSFLSFTWCIIADIDLESEVLRNIGEARYFVYAFWRLMYLKNYKAKFSILKDNIESEQKVLEENEDNERTIKKDFTLKSFYDQLKKNKKFNDKDESNPFVTTNSSLIYYSCGNLSHIGESYKVFPLAKLDDGYMDILSNGDHIKNSSFRKFVNYLLNYHDSGDLFNSKFIGKKECMENLNLDLAMNYDKTKVMRFIPKLDINESDLHSLDYSKFGDKSNLAKKINYKFTNYYSIDGEKYDVQPIQILNKSKTLKVFGYKK